MKKLLVALLLAVMSFGAVCRPSAYGSHEPLAASIINRSYCNLDNNFFDQSAMMQGDAFKNASPEEQKDMLESLFKSKLRKAHAIDFVREHSWQMILTAGALCYLAYQRFAAAHQPVNHDPGNPGNPNQAIAGINGFWANFLASAPIVWTTMDGIQDILKSVAEFLFKKENQHELFRYEREYVRNKPNIDPRFYKVLEEAFNQAHCSGSESDATIKLAKLILALPATVKSIDCDDNRFKLIEDRIAQRYSGEVLRSLMGYAVRLTAASQSEALQKRALYLYGPPGTGKTTGVERLANGLDMPCEKISLGQVKDVADLVGSTGFLDKPGSSGLILEALSKEYNGAKKQKNIIVLIDDADRVLNAPGSGGLRSFLLTLLEPETKSFYSPYVGADIDITHVNFVLTGNSALKDEALANRFECIEFDGYDAAYKKKVVWEEYVPEAIALHKNSKPTITLEDFTQEDREHIDALVEQDKNPGFRTIKSEIMRFVENKLLCKRGPRYCKDNAAALETCAKNDKFFDAVDAHAAQCGLADKPKN